MHATGDDTGAECLRVALTAVRLFLRAHPGQAWRFTELLSDAMLGAVQAWTRYDPGNGATFSTFAHHRAWGAITDGLRERSALTRVELQRGVTMEDLPRQRQPTVPLPVAVDVPDQHAPTAIEQVSDRDAVERLLALIPRRLALIVRAIDLEDVSQLDLARRLGVSQSRVSQLRRQALTLMRVRARSGDASEDDRRTNCDACCSPRRM